MLWREPNEAFLSTSLFSSEQAPVEIKQTTSRGLLTISLTISHDKEHIVVANIQAVQK